jgi:hypothetical protein
MERYVGLANAARPSSCTNHTLPVYPDSTTEPVLHRIFRLSYCLEFLHFRFDFAMALMYLLYVLNKAMLNVYRVEKHNPGEADGADDVTTLGPGCVLPE